jgi:alkanesulfonate monooxygenase SsuD/methylene tetrahydromethanopterin reductase-like flavin-dependent oxidoreductase (luciferase family)
MRHAIFVPPFGELAEPSVMIELAEAVEGHGWDGLFLWDHVLRPDGRPPEVADPWIMMAAIAGATSRIRLGPMVTPLARRRPQKVARETVTLDRLSGGRLTFGIGLGVDTGGELARFGEATDAVERAGLLDDALDLLLALWTGDEVDHRGPHFTADAVRFVPTSIQQPRIPIWAAARGGAPRPVRRAARFEGLFPVDTSLDQLAAMLDIVRAERGSLDDYDVAMLVSPRSDLRAHESAGVTWAMWSMAEGQPVNEIMAIIEAGPPT